MTLATDWAVHTCQRDFMGTCPDFCCPELHVFTAQGFDIVTINTSTQRREGFTVTVVLFPRFPSSTILVITFRR